MPRVVRLPGALLREEREEGGGGQPPRRLHVRPAKYTLVPNEELRATKPSEQPDGGERPHEGLLRVFQAPPAPGSVYGPCELRKPACEDVPIARLLPDLLWYAFRAFVRAEGSGNTVPVCSTCA